MKKILKKILSKLSKKERPLTREETIQKINNAYHFGNFNSNLVNEIYTKLVDYGPIHISKINNFEYDIIFPDTVIYNLTERGLVKFKKSK